MTAAVRQVNQRIHGCGDGLVCSRNISGAAYVDYIALFLEEVNAFSSNGGLATSSRAWRRDRWLLPRSQRSQRKLGVRHPPPPRDEITGARGRHCLITRHPEYVDIEDSKDGRAEETKVGDTESGKGGVDMDDGTVPNQTQRERKGKVAPNIQSQASRVRPREVA